MFCGTREIGSFGLMYDYLDVDSGKKYFSIFLLLVLTFVDVELSGSRWAG